MNVATLAGAVNSSGQLTRRRALLPWYLLAVMPPLLAGCSINHYQPRHFQCVTAVQKTAADSGGWRAACLHVPIVNLAPVYAIYGLQLGYRGKQRIEERVFLDSLPPEMQALAEVVARKLEATFAVTALPRELARTPVPLIVEPR